MENDHHCQSCFRGSCSTNLLIFIKWIVILGVVFYLDGKNRIERQEIRTAVSDLSSQLEVRPKDVFNLIKTTEAAKSADYNKMMDRIDDIDRRLMDSSDRIHKLELESDK